MFHPNGQVRLTIVALTEDEDDFTSDFIAANTTYWPGETTWRPAALAKVKRMEPVAVPVTETGPTSELDATIWVANYRNLRPILEACDSEITVEFRQSKNSISTYWKIIHSRLEFALTIGIALDVKRRTDT